MAIDPFLFVALTAGAIAGRLTRWRSRWVGRGAQGAVVLLVGLLGAELSPLTDAAILGTIPLAAAFVGLLLVLTAGLARLFAGRTPRAIRPAPAPSVRALLVPAILVAAVVSGFLVGRSILFPAADWLEYVLYALLFLTAFDLDLSPRGVRAAGVPLAAAVGGALVTATVMTLAVGIPAKAAFATALGFGFYSLAGPLVTAQLGPSLGLLAFLTNFLRESLTLMIAPTAGAALGAEGLTALGGATAMDTTLYSITRYGDPSAGSSALATGLALTVAATITIPLLLGLPGA